MYGERITAEKGHVEKFLNRELGMLRGKVVWIGMLESHVLWLDWG